MAGLGTDGSVTNLTMYYPLLLYVLGGAPDAGADLGKLPRIGCFSVSAAYQSGFFSHR